MKYKVLIVEDEEVIANTIKKQLESWNMEADCVEDFHNVLGKFVDYEPQLVLMDISLPSQNGFHWCQEIRKVSKVPIIFLSSMSDNMNMVMAMNMGADDFVAKPFNLTFLVTKVQALLRRTYEFGRETNLMEHKGVILNVNNTTVVYEGQKVELTKNEYRILQVLMEQKGRVVSREDIMVKLWEDDSFVDDNTLTVNVTRLRKKLEKMGVTDFIVTKKGIGYMIQD